MNPTEPENTAKSDKIREQNNQFRKSLRSTTNKDGSLIRGRVYITQSLSILPEELIASLIEKLTDTQEPTAGNDPYGENDMGWIDVVHDGSTHKFMWKIDYFDGPNCEWGSTDPSDVTVTFRVLTIMHPSDY
jgi:hypothetical protein